MFCFVFSPQHSPIIDFYPTNFRIDLNGKKYAWQGVALLPFVDEQRLHAALAEVYPNLTQDESKCVCVCVYICMYVCVFVCMYVMYVCYVCMYVMYVYIVCFFMYVHVYVCVYVCI